MVGNRHRVSLTRAEVQIGHYAHKSQKEEGETQIRRVHLAQRRFKIVTFRSRKSHRIFRLDLIRKEMEIAGIIESERYFYRHVKLEYGDGIILPVCCTYESHCEQQLLKITCYEYRELGKQRIFGNGEIQSEALPAVYVPEYSYIRNLKHVIK